MNISFVKQVIKKEFKEELFENFKLVSEIGSEFSYIFPYHLKLFYPVADDRYWFVKDRGPVLINKDTLEYNVLSYNKFMSDHYDKKSHLFDEVILNTRENKLSSYQLFVDSVKERQYIDISDSEELLIFYNLDGTKVEYNDWTDRYESTNSKTLLIVIGEEDIFNRYVNFIEDVGAEYQIMEKFVLKVKRSLIEDLKFES